MKLIVRPIEKWPGPPLLEEGQRARSPFRSSWGMTNDLLTAEMGKLGASEAVLQMAVKETDIRLDGWIRSTARPLHPGVILSFDSRHGPLVYATDRFTGTSRYPGWQCNLRAIALGLQALRAVDRYGISQSGEQYTGWRALETGSGPTSFDEAIEIFESLTGGEGRSYDTREKVNNAYRIAVRRAHPDNGGDDEEFMQLVGARDLLLSRVG